MSTRVAARPDFFARDPFPPGVPHVDPAPPFPTAEEQEANYLQLTRWLVNECLRDATRWVRFPEFRELCALIAVDYDGGPGAPFVPDILPGWRVLDGKEIIREGDKWRPRRKTPSIGSLVMEWQTVPPQLAGQPVTSIPVIATVIRPESQC